MHVRRWASHGGVVSRSSSIHCSQHCLQLLLRRLCSQMLDPPHGLQLLLSRLCSQMFDPLYSLHPILLATSAVVLADARPSALLAVASWAGVLAYARPDALLAVSCYVHGMRMCSLLSGHKSLSCHWSLCETSLCEGLLSRLLKYTHSCI